MATPLSASTALARIRDEGCRVVEYRDWRTHNRNHRGAWGPVNGVMIHHTVTSGTSGSVRLCYEGHSSLPGPLCHTVGAKDGQLYMVGWGRANHAGSGDDDVLRAVINESTLPADNEANTDGNSRFYGIELINLGNGRDPWPEVQVDAAARWAAALCRAHGWSERSVIGHKEWQPGKIDPTFDMGNFRDRVRKLLAAPPGDTTPTPPQEDDMPTVDEIVKGVAKKDGIFDVPLRWRQNNPTNEQWQFESILAFIGDRTLDAHDAVQALGAKLDAQTKTVDQLVQTVATLAAGLGDLDAASIVADLKASIESIDVRLDVTEQP
ncbi:N-acetylmuramoyl-L-alanine amidase [Streptomyces sp. NPDC007063]|uniref:N-acetylmuramoyl-L-alanine amidase n=1 Tax=Streptomyces sp. NPDC007063 TaxID=3364772 RepID=UPI003695F6FB